MGFKNDNQRKAVMATLNNGASTRQNTKSSTLSKVKSSKPKTYIFQNTKTNHKFVQEMFDTPVTTHKVIMNKFTGEEIALAESKNRGNWFVVHLAGDVAQEFGTDKESATKEFNKWRNS